MLSLFCVFKQCNWQYKGNGLYQCSHCKEIWYGKSRSGNIEVDRIIKQIDKMKRGLKWRTFVGYY